MKKSSRHVCVFVLLLILIIPQNPKKAMNSLSEARTVWRYLNGAICIYKPPKYPWSGVSKIIRQRIGEEINSLVPTKRIPYHLNPLVVGPMLTRKQIPIYCTLTDFMSSGVAVVGLRGGWSTVCTHHRSSPLKVYQVKGRLGIGTDTFDTQGLVRERASYFHVTKEILDRVISSIQSNYQRSMFDACGVHIQSQTAYELAAGGLIRPADPNLPVFYSIKCLEFGLPEFTLEVQCINENALFLKRLINEIGFRLRTVAACSGIRCIRYGPFTVEHALAKHNWQLQTFLETMDDCTKRLIADLTSDRLQSPNLIPHSETSWEETEKNLIARGVIRKPGRIEPGENNEDGTSLLLESKESAANENHAQS